MSSVFQTGRVHFHIDVKILKSSRIRFWVLELLAAFGCHLSCANSRPLMITCSTLICPCTCMPCARVPWSYTDPEARSETQEGSLKCHAPSRRPAGEAAPPGGLHCRIWGRRQRRPGVGGVPGRTGQAPGGGRVHHCCDSDWPQGDSAPMSHRTTHLCCRALLTTDACCDHAVTS